MTVPVLDLRAIERTYKTGEGNLPVLKGANLSLAPGELVGLVGPSGSGKSTLLHTAGLLERPDEGGVFLDGEDCLALSDTERTKRRREKLGFVYQFHHLLPEFNAIDNVAMPLMVDGVKRAEARKVARRLLDGMGLAERENHQPGQLSGGEQQRVAIARALVNDPKLVIADEPTGNLDPATTERVFSALVAKAREEGAAVLVATHNMGLTSYMDRVVTVENGLIRQVEPARVMAG
ncbi:MAG: ABC transporter ATP-binding protein [Pseudomonadota bacterium]